MSTRTVVFVAFDGFQPLDLFGPHEVLRVATRLDVDPPYESVVVTPGGADVTTESGVRVAASGSLEGWARSRRLVDTLVVVGGDGTRPLLCSPAVLADIGRLAARARRTTSVCTGALVLGAAGLLDGRQATTHWAAGDELRRAAPTAMVDPDRIYVRDGDVWTSAGVTAGIDLFLALVDDDHGADVAHQVATWLVVFARRPGGQRQFSAQGRVPSPAAGGVAEVLRWLPDHLGADVRVEALAARAGMSARTFARVFRRETGTTPAAHVEALRIEAARRLLETTGLTVAAIARHVGLVHAETLHRAFRRRLGTTPDSYRAHFGRRAS